MLTMELVQTCNIPTTSYPSCNLPAPLSSLAHALDPAIMGLDQVNGHILNIKKLCMNQHLQFLLFSLLPDDNFLSVLDLYHEYQ